MFALQWNYPDNKSGINALKSGKSYFYSDSHNDLPLLKKVTHPVVVDSDDILKEYAKSQGWPQISLR